MTAAISRTSMLCLGCSFDPAQNPPAFMPPDDDALTPVNGIGLKEGSASEGPKCVVQALLWKTPVIS